MLKNYNLQVFFILIIMLTPFLSPIRTDLGWLNVSPVTLKTVWMLIGVIIGFSWWFYNQIQSQKIEIVKVSLYKPIVMFISWCYISLFWVEDGYLAITMLVQYSISGLIFFLIINIFNRLKVINMLLMGLIISMVMISILGLLQYYLIDSYLVQNIFPQFATPSATFGNRNMASHFLVMTLPLAITYIFISNTKTRVILVAIAVFIGSWYVMYISARQAYLAMLIEIVLLGVFFLLDNLKNNKKSYFYIAELIKFKGYIIIIIIISLVLVSNFTNKGWDFFSASKLNRMQDISIEGGGSRFPAWVNTIELIKDNPIIGVGVGQWPQAYPLYYDVVAQDVIFNERVRLKRLHNDYLELLSNLGIVGLLILMSFALPMIKISFNALKNPNNLYRMQVLGLTMGLVGFLVVSLVSFPGRVFLPIFLVMIYTAIIYLLGHAENGSVILDMFSKNANKPIKISLYFLPLLLFFVIFFSYKWIMAEYHYLNAQSLLSRENPEMASNAAIKAINYNHWSPNYYFVAGSSLLIHGVNSQNKKSIQQSILFLKKAIDISPFSTPVLLQLARAYRIENNTKGVTMERKVLEFILSFDPMNVNALAALTKNLAETKEGKKAYIVFQRLKIAFEYFKDRSNFGPYHFSVGYIATQVGDYNYAEYIYKDAIEKFPTYKNYILLGFLEFNHINNKKKAIDLFKKALLINPNGLESENIHSLILKYETNVDL